ncbi:gamma-glutamylcyclotransferase family protein [Deinococcus sp. QL22]|uniref:gamma-glutamylcyclotransferase family protein n=1 Tax=Deinococcus sp. QL22 TaxID=2939437 RepID=UPI0020174480|nr:gamma-glutamylcyclotransferase family protein [Deinococcus sp. QL22]UQN04991.1 gamma-glutamylcyclotransferase [Deinococcus sp. QL22]
MTVPASVPGIGPLTTVFVYGTLMPGERNAGVAARGGTFRAQPATLHGYQLLHLTPEAYPAVIPGSPQDFVLGHALTYAPADWHAALPFLDALEGTEETPPLYTRERVELELQGGQTLPAWVYLYARADRLKQPGADAIASGDWREAPDRMRPRPSDR